jgi:hypothetical protein
MNRLEKIQEEAKKVGKRYDHVMERFQGYVDCATSEPAKVINMIVLYARMKETNIRLITPEVEAWVELTDDEKKVLSIVTAGPNNPHLLHVMEKDELLRECKLAELAGLKKMINEFTIKKGETAPCVKRWSPTVEQMEKAFSKFLEEK